MLNPIKIKVKKLDKEAKIPTLGTNHAAGFDIYSIEETELQPGETKAVSSGISVEIPEGKVLLFWDRSGMGFKGIHRFAGVIDSDYRGELKIILFNSTKNIYKIQKYDRICQGIVQDYYSPEFIEADELTDTLRGSNGLGSTGK